MKMKFFCVTCIGLLAAVSILPGQGTMFWDEAVNGPLSNSGSQPSLLQGFSSGTNSMRGASEYIPFGVYSDYFVINVPAGFEVTQLWLTTDRPIAIWFGSQDLGSEIAYTINPADGNVMELWGLSSIAAGSWGMYVMNYDFDSGASVANYRLDFVVVPEPSTVALLAVGATVLGFRAWRRRG